MMKTFFSISFLMLSFFGQTANNPAQSPEKILNRAVKALGGEKALRGVTSKHATGKITRVGGDEATGNYELETLLPNYYREAYDLNGFETASGFNSKSAWRRDSKNGLQTLTGDASRNFQFLSKYRNARWLDYKREKSKIVFAGTIVIDGKNTDAVTLTTPKNVRIKIYFDSKTNLPAREEIPNGDAIETLDYDDYRTIGGVSEPFSITETLSGGAQYVIKLEEITHNQAIAKDVFNFPRISNAPLPDVAALLKQVEANEDKIEAILENYTYTETQIKHDIGTDGAAREKETEKYQVTFYKGFRIRRLISKDGKPLSSAEAASEDKKAAGAVTDIDNKIAKRAARTGDDDSAEDSAQHVSIAEILRASTLTDPRRERLRERDVIVFDFEPNPKFDYSNAKSLLKFFGKTAGAIWIDEKDKQVARVEASLVDNFNVAGGVLAKLKRGASFILEQNRINDEIWLPSSANINLSVKVLLVKEINVNQNVRYGDYQKFKSEVGGAEIDNAKRP